MPITVLIVDDSALVRQLLTTLLAGEPDLKVVGTAADPFAAREKIRQLAPDVLTLDVEMPRMDGLVFLRNIMRLRPMPVVMFSSLTARGADVTLDALELGAFDVVTKPRLDLGARIEEFREELLSKIRAAFAARHGIARQAPPAGTPGPPPPRAARARRFRTTDRVVALGASTGGTEAIRQVLAALPADAPGMVIVQHIPEAFSGPFAARMNDASAMTVVEAADGMVVRQGHVFVSPGGRHLTLGRDGARYVCRIDDGPPVNRHRPSVDVLFRSVTEFAGPNAVGVLLTGMGDDGARGLLDLRSSGAPTIVQDEATSVVWGMPGAAVRFGAAGRIVSLAHVADEILLAVADGPPARQVAL